MAKRRNFSELFSKERICQPAINAELDAFLEKRSKASVNEFFSNLDQVIDRHVHDYTRMEAENKTLHDNVKMLEDLVTELKSDYFDLKAENDTLRKISEGLFDLE